MPLPTPKNNEDQKTFINRCVGMDSLIKEYPDQKQRLAVCFSQWKKNKQKDSTEEKRTFNFKLDYSEESSMRVDEGTGFLHAKAVLTRSGVFDYYDDEGNLMREYRPDDEVFESESMKSLELRPITNDHPDEMVTVDNIKDLQIGSIGERIEKIDTFLASNIIITDKDMVTTVLNRKKAGLKTELSCGYTCNIVPDLGIHNKDGYYTFRQQNIRYNHVGIVGKARAGHSVRILDNKTKNVSKQKELKMPEKIQFTRKAINLDSFKVNAITKIVDEDNLDVLNELSSKVDEAADVILLVNKDKDSLQGKLDQANDTIKTLNAKIDSLSDVNSPVIVAMIKTRRDVEDIATKLKVSCENKDTKTVMCDCIKASSKDVNLDGKSDDYLMGRFATVKDMLKMQKKNDGDNKFSTFMEKVNDGGTGSPADPRATFINKDKEQNRN